MSGTGGPVGNTKRADQYRIKRTLERLLAAKSSKADVLEGLETACAAVIAKAEEGDIQAFKEMADRLDGKALQGVEVSGPDGDPIAVRAIDWNIVHPKP
jgi:hypothetical protein